MSGYARVVSGQRLGKHVPAATDTNATIEELCFVCGPCRNIITDKVTVVSSTPCGGGVEYLHRDPASRKRRRKGKSRI
jgi:hypothetical protein